MAEPLVLNAMTKASLPPAFVVLKQTGRVDGREIGRGRSADHKYVAGGIHGHAITNIDAEIGAAKNRGIADGRIACHST